MLSGSEMSHGLKPRLPQVISFVRRHLSRQSSTSEARSNSFAKDLGFRIGKTIETEGALGRCLQENHLHDRNNGNGC